MAYSTANPPRKFAEVGIAPPIATARAKAIWIYESADAHATVEGASYFTDATKIGMSLGDLVCVVRTGTPEVTWHFVTNVVAPAAGGYANEQPRACTISAATLA